MPRACSWHVHCLYPCVAKICGPFPALIYNRIECEIALAAHNWEMNHKSKLSLAEAWAYIPEAHFIEDFFYLTPDCIRESCEMLIKNGLIKRETRAPSREDQCYWYALGPATAVDGDSVFLRETKDET